MLPLLGAIPFGCPGRSSDGIQFAIPPYRDRLKQRFYKFPVRASTPSRVKKLPAGICVSRGSGVITWSYVLKIRDGATEADRYLILSVLTAADNGRRYPQFCPRFKCNTPISVHDLSTIRRLFLEITRFKYRATVGLRSHGGGPRQSRT